MRRILVSIFFSSASFMTLMILAVSIFLRHGIGPDSEIYGFEAFEICWTGIIIAFFIGAVLMQFGVLLARPVQLWIASRKRLPRIILFLGLLIIASFGLFAWQQAKYQADCLKPNVFPSSYPKWLDVSPTGHFTFDTHEARLINDWIATHQTGWELGSEDDFNPSTFKAQLLGDNYIIQIHGNIIVFQYYKTEADLTNDPSDSFIIIKRPLSPDDQAFWKALVSQIKSDSLNSFDQGIISVNDRDWDEAIKEFSEAIEQNPT
ncbi:MAG: hypothetical protein ABR955_14945, partial [Verrucomicrobiota bacterium]